MIKNILRKTFYYLKNKKEAKYYRNILPHIEFNQITQQLPNNINKICFVIPSIMKYSGGHTSILRLGTSLSELGYDVYYISYMNQKIEDMKKNAKLNLHNYGGEILSNMFLNDFNTDIYIATTWESVYFIKNLNGYKMYFVQDYEPYFYTYGEKFLLAKKTYELGLHMVSLGKWNRWMIENNCEIKSKIDNIDFPYEKSEYKPALRDFPTYKNKKAINIAVYLKFEEKRAPYIIQIMLDNVKKEFNKKNIKLNINYFGTDKSQKLINGVNLGKLSKEQLFMLYANSDFGLVASLSNISLVPYEMIATKLPVIEFEEGTFKYFFDENCGILTSLDWRILYDKISHYINNGEELEEITNRAFDNISKLSWKKSAKQFKQILDNIDI